MARMRGIHADVIRGSIGGNTFFANQFHQILIRQRTSPVNPHTTFQTQIRQGMAGASIDWNTLTEAQREDWRDYAETLSYNNPLGPITVPGRQVMVGSIGLMRYLQARGVTFASAVKTAPSGSGFLAMDPLTIGAPTVPGTGFSLSIGNPNAENIQVMVLSSGIHSPARQRFKGPFRAGTLLMISVPTLTTVATDITIGADDDIVFVQLRALSDDAPKRLSSVQILRAVVDTNP